MGGVGESEKRLLVAAVSSLCMMFKLFQSTTQLKEFTRVVFVDVLMVTHSERQWQKINNCF